MEYVSHAIEDTIPIVFSKITYDTQALLEIIKSRGLEQIIQGEQERVREVIQTIYLNRPTDEHEQTQEL